MNDAQKPRKHQVYVHGADLHWVEAGEGPPVVLLHGLNDSHRTWNHVLSHLAGTRRVLTPDLPGHGLSGRPDASYDLAWHARVIAAWLDELDLREVDLVGHSFGGGVAQCVLLERRERIRRVALVASGGLGREVGLPVRLMSVPGLVERFGQPFMGAGTRLYLRAGEAHAKDEIAWLSWMNAAPGTARASARTVRSVVSWRGQRRGFMDHAARIDLPPLALFWGDRDPMIPLAHALKLQSAIEGVPLTSFMGCGHFPHQERPEQFARAIAGFVDATTAKPSRLRPPPIEVRTPSIFRRVIRAVAEGLRSLGPRRMQAA